MSKTKFEEQLKVYFPELSRFYVIAKDDSKVWTVIKEMVKMKKERTHGSLKVGYQQGKINGVVKTTSVDD